MVKEFLTEAVVDSLEAALAAEAAGADRLELCAALELGGITPGMGLMRAVCTRVQIPVFVLIRSRGGSFECSPLEFETLMLEGQAALTAGVSGIVAGILTAEGRIDVPRMQELVRAVHPLPVTFHRAFDRARDRDEAVADLLATGCQRLLSSGMTADALAGAATLQWLRTQTAGQLIVMPGGGITADNITAIADATEAVEFHFSAIQKTDDGKWLPSPEKVSAICKILHDRIESTK